MCEYVVEDWGRTERSLGWTRGVKQPLGRAGLASAIYDLRDVPTFTVSLKGMRAQELYAEY